MARAGPRAGLRWSLTQLRQALGDAHVDLIRADRETVGLRAERLDIDLSGWPRQGVLRVRPPRARNAPRRLS